MEIGINDDFIDEIDDFANEVTPDGEEQDLIEQDPVVEKDPEESVDEDFVTSLLKAKGIDDKTKIKFENEEGSVEEVDWDTLSNEDKFNILNTSTDESETDLDDTEIQLINAIRESGMTPSEYLQYLEQSTINRYIQNNTQPEYSVDQYNDEELFIADFIRFSSSVLFWSFVIIKYLSNGKALIKLSPLSSVLSLAVSMNSCHSWHDLNIQAKHCSSFNVHFVFDIF